MPVVHCPGKYHINGDTLSCIPEPLKYCPNYRAGTRLSRLPCYSQLNPYKFCTRAEETGALFMDDVDYMIPLSVRKITVNDSTEPTADIFQFGHPQFTQEELRRAQVDDVDLLVVIKWLESEECLCNWTYLSTVQLCTTIACCKTRLFFEMMLCFIGGRTTVPFVIFCLSLILCRKKCYVWALTCEMPASWTKAVTYWRTNGLSDDGYSWPFI